MTPTDRKSVGVNLCFLHINFCLSVGAFFERPRANAVRPYRVLDNFFANFARLFGIRFSFILFYNFEYPKLLTRASIFSPFLHMGHS